MSSSVIMFSQIVNTNLCIQLTVLWKVVEKFMSPKSPKTSAGETKSSTQGVKWSIGAGTNLLQGFAAKVDRENKQRLNEFAKELRSFRSVDMSGALNDLTVIITLLMADIYSSSFFFNAECTLSGGRYCGR